MNCIKNKTGLLPENLQQIGLDDTHMDLSFYEKKNQLEYEVWYGLDLGTSMIYNSKTKKWRKEG
nr:hypothetical protein [Bacteroidales bacterium]